MGNTVALLVCLYKPQYSVTHSYFQGTQEWTWQDSITLAST